MNQQTIISLFGQLGKLFRDLGRNSHTAGSGVTASEFEHLQEIIRKEQQYNPWFTEKNILAQLAALSAMLEVEQLNLFAQSYRFSENPKRVGLVMAGNLPLVGFHDLLCVVLSGNIAVCKLSSQDVHLLPAFVAVLNEWNPGINEKIQLVAGPMKDIDAVIATGSDNSAGYFEQYFGKYPHIFRQNRTSVAVLDGSETADELTSLAKDLFAYFGMGCRNVSHLIVPEEYDLNLFFAAIVEEGEIINHHKYANNYDYNRTIFLMNKLDFLDNNFVLLKEDQSLFSPLAVIHFHRYSSNDEIEQYLAVHKDQIQVVVGHNYVPFGKAQYPAINDFADNVDTMQFLESLMG